MAGSEPQGDIEMVDDIIPEESSQKYDLNGFTQMDNQPHYEFV